MNGTARQTQLTELHASSKRMLELAQVGDWAAVNRLQEQQHELAESIFTEPVEPADAVAVADIIKTVISINEQIADLGLQAREGCLVEAGEQQQRRHALQQYTANSE